MINFECIHCFQEFDIIEMQTWDDQAPENTCKLCMEWFDSKQRKIVWKAKELLNAGIES